MMAEANTNPPTHTQGKTDKDKGERGEQKRKREGFGPYKAGPQYPEGDPAKGRDPERDIPMYIKGPQIAMRDRRAYLVDQAVKNESANDAVNAKEVENNQRIAELMFDALDPDRLRDETTEAALDELDRHTPEGAAAAREQRLKILEANNQRQAAKANAVAAQTAVDHRKDTSKS